ncbi:adhesion G protein-coupled receptor E5-like [Dysidea avara]|uniref:adhesion G protein-coupled receptor E5-like n=1 Tax=Dysidea avara TaxID=196820 RepID=UPI00331950A1
MLSITMFIMIISLFKIYQSRRTRTTLTNTQKERVAIAKLLFWSIMALLPLLGGTWILGLLFLIDSDSVALAWIFTMVNSMQGAAIFFFHVVRNKEVMNTVKDKYMKWKRDKLLQSSLKDSVAENKNEIAMSTVGKLSESGDPGRKFDSTLIESKVEDSIVFTNEQSEL